MAVAGDEDLAREQLRSQLREKVVVDRETVWSQMVSGHRSQGIFRSVEPEVDVATYEGGSDKSIRGRLKALSPFTGKAFIFMLAVAALVAVIQVQPFDRVEESNCLAMLIFCTILWATEVRIVVA